MALRRPSEQDATTKPIAVTAVGLARIIPDDPKHFASLLYCLEAPEWPRLFQAVYDTNKWKGGSVRESAERAQIRFFKKRITGKDGGHVESEEILLSVCANDAGELTKIKPEYLRSAAGARFLQRLGKKIGKKQNQWGDTEKIDAFLVYGWAHCLFRFFPPFAFFTDAALASFVDLCIFRRESCNLNLDTMRQWRKRWGLVHPSRFLIRRIEPAGKQLRVVWIDDD